MEPARIVPLTVDQLLALSVSLLRLPLRFPYDLLS
jgi:hypothetical protein